MSAAPRSLVTAASFSALGFALSPVDACRVVSDDK